MDAGFLLSIQQYHFFSWVIPTAFNDLVVSQATWTSHEGGFRFWYWVVLRSLMLYKCWKLVPRDCNEPKITWSWTSLWIRTHTHTYTSTNLYIWNLLKDDKSKCWLTAESQPNRLPLLFLPEKKKQTLTGVIRTVEASWCSFAEGKDGAETSRVFPCDSLKVAQETQLKASKNLRFTVGEW